MNFHDHLRKVFASTEHIVLLTCSEAYVFRNIKAQRRWNGFAWDGNTGRRQNQTREQTFSETQNNARNRPFNAFSDGHSFVGTTSRAKTRKTSGDGKKSLARVDISEDLKAMTQNSDGEDQFLLRSFYIFLREAPSELRLVTFWVNNPSREKRCSDWRTRVWRIALLHNVLSGYCK